MSDEFSSQSITISITDQINNYMKNRDKQGFRLINQATNFDGDLARLTRLTVTNNIDSDTDHITTESLGLRKKLLERKLSPAIWTMVQDCLHQGGVTHAATNVLNDNLLAYQYRYTIGTVSDIDLQPYENVAITMDAKNEHKFSITVESMLKIKPPRPNHDDSNMGPYMELLEGENIPYYALKATYELNLNPNPQSLDGAILLSNDHGYAYSLKCKDCSLKCTNQKSKELFKEMIRFLESKNPSDKSRMSFSSMFSMRASQQNALNITEDERKFSLQDPFITFANALEIEVATELKKPMQPDALLLKEAPVAENPKQEAKLKTTVIIGHLKANEDLQQNQDLSKKLQDKYDEAKRDAGFPVVTLKNDSLKCNNIIFIKKDELHLDASLPYEETFEALGDNLVMETQVINEIPRISSQVPSGKGNDAIEALIMQAELMLSSYPITSEKKLPIELRSNIDTKADFDQFMIFYLALDYFREMNPDKVELTIKLTGRYGDDLMEKIRNGAIKNIRFDNCVPHLHDLELRRKGKSAFHQSKAGPQLSTEPSRKNSQFP